MVRVVGQNRYHDGDKHMYSLLCSQHGGSFLTSCGEDTVVRGEVKIVDHEIPRQLEMPWWKRAKEIRGDISCTTQCAGQCTITANRWMLSLAWVIYPGSS